MATYSRLLLSGSTNGLPIPIATTSTLGTVVHSSVAGATSFDEIYAWASNVSSAAVALTVEWGGATDPGNLLVKQLSIPANSPPIPIATGFVLNNSKMMTAYAAVTSAINIAGFVNRIA